MDEQCEDKGRKPCEKRLHKNLLQDRHLRRQEEEHENQAARIGKNRIGKKIREQHIGLKYIGQGEKSKENNKAG